MAQATRTSREPRRNPLQERRKRTSEAGGFREGARNYLPFCLTKMHAHRGFSGMDPKRHRADIMQIFLRCSLCRIGTHTKKSSPLFRSYSAFRMESTRLGRRGDRGGHSEIV